MYAAVSAMNKAARTFTEARDLLNRSRIARGYNSVVSLAVLQAIENSGQDWKISTAKARTGARLGKRRRQGQAKGTTTFLHLLPDRPCGMGLLISKDRQNTF